MVHPDLDYLLQTPVSPCIVNSCLALLQVRGNLFCENQTISAKSEFSADVLDYGVSVQVDFEGEKEVKFAPLGWRYGCLGTHHMAALKLSYGCSTELRYRRLYNNSVV